MATQGKTSNRGFASMDRDKQRAIASKGGQSVPPEERSFSKDPALAASAGRKGGMASHGGGSRSGAGASASGADSAAGTGASGASGRKGAGQAHGQSHSH